jgi:hypothetical protein
MTEEPPAVEQGEKVGRLDEKDDMRKEGIRKRR